MKAQEIFDICHARYRGCREFLRGRISAADLDTPSGSYLWRPDRVRAEEYAADFEMVGERALARPEWKGRRKLFRILFLRGVEYRRAITLVGIAEGTFDWWLKEVKKTVGRALDRAGLFPPGDYFRKPAKTGKRGG